MAVILGMFVMLVAVRSRLGRRILLMIFASVLMAVMAVTSMFVWFQFSNLVSARRSGMMETGLIFANSVADDMAQGNRQAVLKAVKSITLSPGISSAVVLSNDGKIFASSGATPKQGELAVRKPSLLNLIKRETLSVGVNVVRNGEAIGRLVVVAEMTKLRRQIVRSALITFGAGILAGLLGVLVAARLQRRITEPILSLINAMTRIRDTREYSERVTCKSEDESGVLVDTFNSMISEIRYRDISLKKLAFFDPLTGLANRQEFHRQVSSLSTSEFGQNGAAVLLIDFDALNSVNDTYGHTVGDALLVTVAAALKWQLPSGSLVARLGGDEFTAIIPRISSEEEVHQALVPLLKELSEPVSIMGRQFSVTLSTGVVLVPSGSTNTLDVLRQADLALNAAKRNGRGSIGFYRASLDEEVQKRMALVADLRNAVPENQLEVHYQPQVSIHSGLVEGFESLLRWKHPQLGYVPPETFISIAEETGLICCLGEWVMRESCQQARKWLDAGHLVRQISVNVSVAQIRQPNFHLHVRDTLAETRLPPHMLCLELTESLFAGTSAKRVREELDQLKDTGVTLAIDDFGMGYSSLSYLLGLPFDKLKIDRAFVGGIEKDPEKRQLLTGLIDLGHALDLTVVAEGVETAGEVDLLRDMQADQVQGYIFSKPLKADEAIEVMRRISADFVLRFPARRRPGKAAMRRSA